jgi:PAS domain S-box-containing protein
MAQEIKFLLNDFLETPNNFISFLDSLNDWIWAMDLNAIHTFSNKAVEKILGYKVEEIIGHSVFKLWGNTSSFRSNELTIETLQKGEPWINVKGIFQHKNGSIVYTESSAYPVFDENSQLIGYRGIDRDITDKVLLQKSLTDSNNKFSIVMDLTPVPIMMYQGNKFVYANKAAQKLCKYSLEEIYNLNFWSLVHPEDIEMAKKNGIARQDKQKAIDEYKLRVIDKYGSIRWVKLYGISTYISGRPIAIISLLDITTNIRYEELMAKSNKLLKEISSIFRHDIGNDLAVIKSALRLYDRTGEKEMLNAINERIGQSLSRIDSNRISESFVNKCAKLELMSLDIILKQITSDFPNINFEINGKGKVYADSHIYHYFQLIIEQLSTITETKNIIINIRKMKSMFMMEILFDGRIFELDQEFISQFIKNYSGDMYQNAKLNNGKNIIILLKSDLKNHH